MSGQRRVSGAATKRRLNHAPLPALMYTNRSMSHFSSRQRPALLLALLLAFGLRLHHLGADSLWYDESVSALLAAKPLAAMWAHTARDIHPPLYYALLHLWTSLAGRTEFALAFLSLFCGVVAVALSAHLGRRSFGPGAGSLAALLAAFSPLAVWYGQEVRMYTLGICWLLGLLILAWRFARGEGSTWGLASGVAVLAALSLWTLYYSGFALLALNLFVLPWLWLRARRRLGPWLLAQAAALLLFAPWLPIALRQVLHPPVPPWRAALPALDLLRQAWVEGGAALVAGQSVDPERWQPWAILGLVLALLAFALPSRFDRRRPWAGTLLLWTSVAGPLALILLASILFTPLYHVRYLALYSGAFPVLLAGGLAAIVRVRWPWPGLRLALAAGLCLGLLIASLLSLRNYYGDRFAYEAADDLRGAVRAIDERLGPRDAVLIDAGYLYPAFLRYWPGGIGWLGRLSNFPPSEPLPPGPAVVLAGHIDGDPAAVGGGDPASDFYAISSEDTAAHLSQLFASANTVWLLRGYDTVNDPQGFIRAWLEQNGQLIYDQVFPGGSFVRVQGWRSSQQPRRQAAISHPLEAETTGGVKLLGFDLGPVEPGRPLRLTLYWQRRGPIDRSWKVFNQLLGPDGALIAQQDGYPGLGALLTSAWQPGEIVESTFVLDLPSGLAPGEYRLITGLYDETSGARLPLASGDDAITLTTLSLP